MHIEFWVDLWREDSGLYFRRISYNLERYRVRISNGECQKTKTTRISFPCRFGFSLDAAPPDGAAAYALVEHPRMGPRKNAGAAQAAFVTLLRRDVLRHAVSGGAAQSMFQAASWCDSQGAASAPAVASVASVATAAFASGAFVGAARSFGKIPKNASTSCGVVTFR